MTTVTKADVTEALRALGVHDGDILLFHSSLKSFGRVEGGPDTVIDGALEALSPGGTLVAPTLVQRDFGNAYKNWNIATSPSDVGLLTETLRLRPEAVRSDQATHSVAAIGPAARELTEGHMAFGPRGTPYGEYAFSASSPWQKMYDRHAKVIFMGVLIRCNTYRHFVEARFVEELLAAIPEGEEKEALIARLTTHDLYDEYVRQLGAKAREHTPMTITFPNFNGDKMLRLKPTLAAEGIEKVTRCGDATLTLYPIHEMVDIMDRAVREETEEWFSDEELAWIQNARALAAPQH